MADSSLSSVKVVRLFLLTDVTYLMRFRLEMPGDVCDDEVKREETEKEK